MATKRRNELDVVIRKLEPGDEPRAAEACALFKSGTQSVQRAGRFLADPRNYLVVAEVGDDLAGFLVAYRLGRLDRDADQLFVYEIEVAREFRRRGVGTQLMQWVRRTVEDEHLMEAFVLTDRGNPAAIGLYGSTGAHVEGDSEILFVYPGHAA